MVREMLTMTITRMVNDSSANKVQAYFDVDINGLDFTFRTIIYNDDNQNGK